MTRECTRPAVTCGTRRDLRIDLRTILLVLIGPLVLGVQTPPIAAQNVRGRLLDDETEQPISFASVRLLSERNDTVAGVASDSAGSFLLAARAPGRYRFFVERIGYRSAVSPLVALFSGDTLDVEFRLSTEAVLLSPLTVTASRLPPGRSLTLDLGGFYERERFYGREGLGHGRLL